MQATQWGGCRVVVGAAGGAPACEDDDADLSLAEGGLLLSYWDEAGAVVYVGVEEEPGRFELVARSRPRRATLRREGPRRLAGSWFEGAATGTLSVELPAACALPPEVRS